MGDDATVEILLQWKQENEAVLKDVQAQLAALGVQTAATNEATKASGNAAQAAGPWWLGLAIAIAAVALVLSPFIILIGAATVIVTAFAVAGAGALLLLGGLAAGFVAVGAAIAVFGGGGIGSIGAGAALTTATTQLSAAQQNVIDLQQKIAAQGFPATLSQRQQMEDLLLKQTQAQQKYSDALAASQTPAAVLVSQLTLMTGALQAQAAPMAALIIQWAGGAIPAVQQLGSSIMDWFGARLPGVLAGISQIFKDLGPTFQNFGQFVGSTMDKVFGMTTIGSGGTIVTMGQLFTQAIQGMMGGLQGFIGLLAQLTSWFLERLPAYGPIVNQVFGFLGNVIIGVFQVWGRFADWLVGQWPAITDLASRAVKSISDQWAILKPQWDDFISRMGPALYGTLKFVADNAGSIVPIVQATIIILSFFALGILALVGAIGLVINKFTELGNTISSWRKAAINDIEAVQNALNGLTGGGSGNGSTYNRYGTGSRQRGFI